MTTWQDLIDELDRWSEAGVKADFWWRDDDAATHTPQLDLLFKHAGSLPLALAVIPSLATSDLADRLREEPSAVVMQHGWRHSNHSASGKSEYPASRSAHDVSEELAEGRRILTAFFGNQSIAVFVPPWHGFDDQFLPLLPKSGISGLSRKGPRVRPLAMEGLLEINAHAAPIKWTVPPSYGDDDTHLSIIIDHLRGRRDKSYDPDEPTGLLTHHLTQNDRSYEFVSRLVHVVSEHPAAIWRDSRDLFGSAAPGQN